MLHRSGIPCMEGIRPVEETALKAAGSNSLGGSSPSPSARARREQSRKIANVLEDL